MRVSTVAWHSLMVGSAIVAVTAAGPAAAKTKHATTIAGHAPRLKNFAEQDNATSTSKSAPRLTKAMTNARTHYASAGMLESFGRPVVFHPTSTAPISAAFRFAAPAGHYQWTMHGTHFTFSHGFAFPEHGSKHSLSKTGKARFAMRGGKYGYSYAPETEAEPAPSVGDEEAGGSLQCVPFARAASGIELKGNALDWWYAAEGVYQRGSTPEPGSVLNFRSNGHMRLGHVAVVSAVIGAREILIDHANWAGAGAYKGGVARGVHVIDVSPDNDWSAVRVALQQSPDFGSVYPTYGFIYDRPDSGVMLVNARHRPTRNHISEVAEAPE